MSNHYALFQNRMITDATYYLCHAKTYQVPQITVYKGLYVLAGEHSLTL